MGFTEIVKKSIAFLRFILALIYVIPALCTMYGLFTLNHTLYTTGLYGYKTYTHIRLKLKPLFGRIMLFSFFILNGRTFYVSIDKNILKTKNVLFTSNHVAETDFIFIIAVLMHFNMYSNVIFVMKESVFFMPLFGQLCKYCNFIGIDRKSKNKFEVYERDIGNIDRDNFQLVIFPEGTTFGEHTYEKNKEWCKKNGIDSKYELVLYPRAKGWEKAREVLVDSYDKNEFINCTLLLNPFFNNFSPMSRKIKMMMFEGYKISMCLILEKHLEGHFEKELLKSYDKKEKCMEGFMKQESVKNIDEFRSVLKKLNQYDLDNHIQVGLSCYTHGGVISCILVILGFVWLNKLFLYTLYYLLNDLYKIFHKLFTIFCLKQQFFNQFFLMLILHLFNYFVLLRIHQ